VRAVCTAESATYPARILETYGPDGSPPLGLVRSIALANGGGHWVFEAFGASLSFEDEQTYTMRRKADRFPRASLERYLKALRIDVDSEPLWTRAVLVESTK
jgi:hypothetical protein